MANISLNLSLTGAILIGSASAHGCHQPKYQWKNVRNETTVRKKEYFKHSHDDCLEIVKGKDYVEMRQKFSLDVLYKDCMTRKGLIVQ